MGVGSEFSRLHGGPFQHKCISSNLLRAMIEWKMEEEICFLILIRG